MQTYNVKSEMTATFIRFAGQMTGDGKQIVLVRYEGQEMQVSMSVGYKGALSCVINGNTVKVVPERKK